MTDETQSQIEVTAPSVEEAIAEGLMKLGRREDEVLIEVLDEGGSGFLGLMSRQARVLLKLKPESVTAPTVSTPPTPEPDVPEEPSDEADDTLKVAQATVQELLEKMHFQAEVSAYYGKTTPGRNPPVMVDIHGKDLSILIGRRSKTLDSLQLIAHLIISRELKRGVNLVVDVEDHRKRREERLRRMAQRMAEQAINTGKRQILEPMSARDRRIIHIELRDNPHVTTESIDEEPNRKVTIIPQ
ncbi:MAG: RNA-binding cell elongation regulator Jag/EloR [Chloroflexota bacterium]